MAALRVTTWNVLHRVHAVNWKEAPVETYPDERVRTAAITAVVARWLEAEGSVVCLQEVSGDQLASLRELGHSVHVHTYPRVPAIRGEGLADLDDRTEQLVTITNGPSTKLTAHTFDSDPGKGLLAVTAFGVTVVNTHVSAGERRNAQLAALETLARGAGHVVVLGDFNAPVDVVRAGLGSPVITSEGPTRIATHEHPAKTIDHVAVLGGTLVSSAVLDGAGLSDHHPVTADVRFDG